MKQNINIAALLKDCPKGTKLYSPAYGEVEFDKLEPLHTTPTGAVSEEKVIKVSPTGYTFDEYGRLFCVGECLLFPSKDVRGWNYWQADYVKLSQDRDKNLKMLKLLSKEASNHLDYSNFGTEYIGVKGRDSSLTIHSKGSDIGKYILSTGTELKLEEEQPKFKVKKGDVTLSSVFGFGVAMENTNTFCEIYNGKQVDQYTPDRLATPEEIAKWNKETLEPNHLHYSKSKRKIIDWFLPFDKVLVRDDNQEGWCAGFYSHYKVVNRHGLYFTTAGCACECIPYNEKTKHLVGTTDDYKEQ